MSWSARPCTRGRTTRLACPRGPHERGPTCWRCLWKAPAVPCRRPRMQPACARVAPGSVFALGRAQTYQHALVPDSRPPRSHSAPNERTRAGVGLLFCHAVQSICALLLHPSERVVRPPSHARFTSLRLHACTEGGRAVGLGGDGAGLPRLHRRGRGSHVAPTAAARRTAAAAFWRSGGAAGKEARPRRPRCARHGGRVERQLRCRPVGPKERSIPRRPLSRRRRQGGGVGGDGCGGVAHCVGGVARRVHRPRVRGGDGRVDGVHWWARRCGRVVVVAAVDDVAALGGCRELERGGKGASRSTASTVGGGYARRIRATLDVGVKLTRGVGACAGATAGGGRRRGGGSGAWRGGDGGRQRGGGGGNGRGGSRSNGCGRGGTGRGGGSGGEAGTWERVTGWEGGGGGEACCGGGGGRKEAGP